MADYSGYLYNSSGLPLINTKVVAHNAATAAVLATVYTDSTGLWDFGALSVIPTIYAYTEFGTRLVFRGEIVGTLGATADFVTGGALRGGATAVLTGDGFYIDYNAGTPRLRVGTVSGGALVKGIYWDGANYAWIGVNTSLTAAGLFTATNAVITGTITATAGSLSSLDISGLLTIGTSGGIFQGTGTFAVPTTALKIYNSGGIGLLEMWGSGTKQVYFGTDGALYAGAGNIRLNASGLVFTQGQAAANRITWIKGADTPAFVEVWDGGAGSQSRMRFEVFATVANESAAIFLATYADSVDSHETSIWINQKQPLDVANSNITMMVDQNTKLELLTTHVHLNDDTQVTGYLTATTYLWAGTYAAVGFVAAPANTTAGDLTATRLALNDNVALTAILHLKAGTAAASTAPLKFTSGPLLTTAEAGAIEFLTDAYYATITTGAARRTFAFLESPSFTTPSLGAASATSLAATAFVTAATYLWAGTYAAVGFTSAPANTTAGDLTASRLRLGTDAAFSNSAIFQVAQTLTSASVNARGILSNFTFDGAGGGAGGYAFTTTHTLSASTTIVYGTIINSVWNPPTGVTITDGYNLWARSETGSDVGAVTRGSAIYIAPPSLGSLKPGGLYGINIANQGVAGVGTSVGLLMAAQSGATTTWDVYHAGTAPNIAIGNGGTLSWKDASANVLATLVDLGTTGAFNVTGHFRVAGTQVVGARVVDARIDDAIGGTWTATEQGILDACRDALITHGLVAAA